MYDHPELLDAAFGFRDFEKEVDFLEAVFVQHTGKTANSFLEIGCGPANHAIRLAKRGHLVYALDISKTQLEYAKEKAQKASAKLTFLREDMTDYDLPDESEVDVAVMLLGTLNFLQTNEEVQSCWEATMKAMKPGGLLIVETLHNHDIFDGTFAQGEYWEAPLDEEQIVVMEYGTDDDQFDQESQVLRKRIGLSVRREEAIDLQGEGYVWQRIFTYQELRLLAESVGIEVVAAYGDLDLNIDLDHVEAGRLVLCLQKPSSDSAL